MNNIQNIKNIKENNHVILYDNNSNPFLFSDIQTINENFIVVKGVNFSKLDGKISNIQNIFSDKWISNKIDVHTTYPFFKNICSKIEIFDNSVLIRKHITKEMQFEFDNHNLQEIMMFFPEKLKETGIPKNANILNINNLGILVEYYETESLEECNSRFFSENKLEVVN